MLGNTQERNTQEQRGTQQARMATSDMHQWLEQLRQDFQHRVGDRLNLAQRFAQFLEEHQRREERRSTLEQQCNQFRNEYAEGMTEAARSFIEIRQEFQGRGAMFVQLRKSVTHHLMPNLRTLKTEHESIQAQPVQLSQEHNQYSSGWSNAAVRLRESQENLLGTLTYEFLPNR